MLNALALALGIVAAAVIVAIVAVERRLRRFRYRLKETEQRLAETNIVVRSIGGVLAAEWIGTEKAPGAVEAVFNAGQGEDRVLFWLFNRAGGPLRTGGYYIECGAFDGVRRSVTHIFDACGWTGLLVEPLPHLVEACRRSRPRARVVHAALGPKGSSGTIEFVHRTDNEGRSSAPSLRGERGRATAHSGPNRKHISVPLTTLDDALGDYGGPVDLLVLDVEGAELAVLRGFDLAGRRPAVLLIEDNSLGKNEELPAHVISCGYRSIGWLSRNRLFIHESQADLLARARELFLTRDPHRKSCRGLA